MSKLVAKQFKKLDQQEHNQQTSSLAHFQRETEQDQDKRQAAWTEYENDRKQWHTTLQRLETLLDKWEKQK